MKYLLLTLAIAALAVPAFGQGQNPTAKMFVHITEGASPVEPTDNATVVNTGTPAAFATVRAYIGVTDFTGLSSLVFKLNNVLTDYPGVVGTQSFTNLLPDNLAIGNAFGNPANPGGNDDGITLATACATGPFVLAGYAEYFYLGGDFTVEILDHGNPLWEGWIVDCQAPGVVDQWCVWLNGAVGAATPPAGDAGCEANTPVEDATWGAVKALYR